MPGLTPVSTVGPIERPVERAAGLELGARLDRVLDDAVDAVDLRAADDRPERDLPERIADRQVLGLGRQLLGERRGDPSHWPARGPSPCRSGPGGTRRRRRWPRPLASRSASSQDDDGVLAAELELDLLQMLAGEFADAPADAARAGERHHRDVGIGADRLARLGAARQHLQHALRQPGVLEDAGDDEAAGQRRARIGLQHDRVAGRERGSDGAASTGSSGKLNGEMTPMTPRGRRRARLMRPGLDGSTRPCGSVHMAEER